MPILIKNGLILDPVKDASYTNTHSIYIQNGCIADIPETPPSDTKIIDADNCWISPGLIDIHCHLRDPGFTAKEDLETGAQSAAAGGFTTICPMANTKPAIDEIERLEYVQLRSKEKSSVQILQHAAVSKGLAGREMVDMPGLWSQGAVAFSDDGLPYDNAKLLKTALQYAKTLEAVVVSHAEEASLATGGCIRESKESLELGVHGIPAEAESVAVARELEILRSVPGAHLHFSHISTANSVHLIRQAKDQNLHVTAETTPHHLLLTVEAVSEHLTRAKMNPPLATKEDQEALIEGILDGTLEALATDHAPHTEAEKSKALSDAPFGITGFETALAIYLQVLVHSGRLSPLALIKLLTVNPIKCLQIRHREVSLDIGSKANLTLINPELYWSFTPEITKSKACNSPFYGMSLRGRAIYTIVDGEIVYSV